MIKLGLKRWSSDVLKSSFRIVSSVSIYYAPESDFGVKTYDHLKFLSASGFQFRASRYVMRQNRTSV